MTVVLSRRRAGSDNISRRPPALDTRQLHAQSLDEDEIIVFVRTRGLV